jgi:cell division protein FtsB
VKKKSECDIVKLLKENVTLITELNRLRQENRDMHRDNVEMQSVLGISSRQMLPSQAKKKLEKAVMDKDHVERMFKNKIDKLEEEVKILIEENQNLRIQLS